MLLYSTFWNCNQLVDNHLLRAVMVQRELCITKGGSSFRTML